MAIVTGGLQETPVVDADRKITREWNRFLTTLGGGGVSPFAVVVPVAFSATPTFDCSLSNGQPILFTMTLTGNVASSSISNAKDGQEIYFEIFQDATGGRTFAWDPRVSNPLAVNTAIAAGTGATLLYDSTNNVFICATGGVIWPLISTTANPATAGTIRLAKSDTIQFRNNANSGNISAISLDSSNRLSLSDTSVVGSLHVSGDATLGTSGGAIVTLGDNLSGSYIQLTVHGSATTVGGDANITGSLDVTGGITGHSGLAITGGVTVTGSSAVSIGCSSLTVSPGGTTILTVQSGGPQVNINGELQCGKFLLGAAVLLFERTITGHHYIGAQSESFQFFDTGGSIIGEVLTSGDGYVTGNWTAANLLYKNSVNFGPAAVTSITVVNGQITAIS